AKRLYRSIARTAKYGKQEAVNTLEALIAFRRRESQFNRHPHVTAAFGIHFRGIETEFDRFERLSRFYTKVETHFRSPKKKSLRAFLREGDVADMELLPAIPEIQVEITYDGLQERMEGAAAQATSLEEAITALQPLVQVFADPSSVKPREIGGLMETMRALLDEEATLDECNEARVILADRFNGS